MKIKDDLMLRNIAGEWVVIPMGLRLLEFNGMLTMNDSGAFLWKLLEHDMTRENLIAAMLNEYEIGELRATADIDAFIKTLMDKNIMEV